MRNEEVKKKKELLMKEMKEASETTNKRKKDLPSEYEWEKEKDVRKKDERSLFLCIVEGVFKRRVMALGFLKSI